MKGLEIAKQYYLEYGKQMIDDNFGSVADRIAVGLVGEGSECFGYDDNLSVDHDFEPAFCLWITKEDEREFGFKLERAYAKLPKEFMGLKKQILSPAGGNRHGVLVIDDFYLKLLGASSAPDSVERWLYTPEHAFASVTNGEVFRDDLGVFSAVRDELKKGYPEDIRLKKLAARAAFMAQAGQYNYGRCIDRGETGAAQLAIFDFVKNAIGAVYLLNNKYQPFYKWAYRGMRDLPILGDLEMSLTFLTETGNSPSEATTKREMIEDIAGMFIDVFKDQNISEAFCNNLDTHAFSIEDHIKDGNIRNMHIMAGVN